MPTPLSLHRPTRDPQAGTVADTYTQEEYKDMCTLLFNTTNKWCMLVL